MTTTKNPTGKLPQYRPFKFADFPPDAQGTVIVDGKRITRIVLKLLPQHRNKLTWSCGQVQQHDIDNDRYIIVDFDNFYITDYIVDTEQGLRELKRFSLQPGVKVVIELTLQGNPHHITEVVQDVLDMGTLQEAIRNFKPRTRPVFVRSATVVSQTTTMIRRAT